MDPNSGEELGGTIYLTGFKALSVVYLKGKPVAIYIRL